jgi:hypothetical protein
MDSARYLCSQLVSLKDRSGTPTGNSVVNLEEIWRSGAVLESEQALEDGSRVEIRCGTTFFAAVVTGVEKHEFGWRVEVEFSPMTPWNPEEFQPEHLLDPRLGLAD